MEGIVFVAPVPEERYEDVIVHLRNSFFADEPLNKAVNLCEIGKPHMELEHHSLVTLKDCLSVMATDADNGQVIGAALNGILHPGDLEEYQHKLEAMTDERFKRIFGLLYGLNQALDLFGEQGVDRIFECRILSVDPSYRGRGLARELLSRSEQIAKEKGFKVIKEDATSYFSQKIAASLGHQSIYELKYSDYKGDTGKAVFQPQAPHNSLKIMVKVLE